MRRKWLSVVVLILFIGAGATWYTNWQYPIHDDEWSIQQGFNEWQRDTAATPESYTVVSTTQLGESSSHIILFETSSSGIGYAQMIKGWNGKFKIVQSGWGPDMSYHDIDTNEGTYGILVGVNPELRIDHILVESSREDYSFTAQLQEEGPFLVHQQLPQDVTSAFPAEFTFFNESGEEIDPVLE